MSNWNAHNWQRSHAEVLKMRKQIGAALRAPFALAAEQRKDFVSYVTQLEDVLHGGRPASRAVERWLQGYNWPDVEMVVS